jgi:hypothetical protein
LHAARMAPTHMAWFQVTCPCCSAALQTKLGVGTTSVQCSQCKKVFAVDVKDGDVSGTSAPPVQRRRKKDGDVDMSAGLKAYHDFMSLEMRRLYRESPNLTKQQVMQHAAALWHDSDMNPKNAPAVQEDDVDMGRAAGKRPANPKGTPNKGGARKNVRCSNGAGTSADAGPPRRPVRRMDGVGAAGDGGGDEPQNSAAAADMTGNDVPMSWIAAARRAVGL